MYTIRKATLSDIPLLHHMAEQVFPDTYRQILTPAQIRYMMEWMYSPCNLRKQMEEEGHIYYLAFRGSEAAGYVSIRQEEENLFHLEKLYVLPRFRKDRIGQKLFGQALAAIRELHPSPCRMELNVNRHNPALGFYEHMGMRKVREGDFPIGNGYYMNDYIMGMELL